MANSRTEEKKIPIDDPTGKWSDLTLMPEWEEPYYNVYSIRKHGKWVMCKALKEEYTSDPDYKAALEKEFEVRYQLAHPNIVLVNDFENIPGIGMAIVTDDVYGYSLRRLIDEKRLSPLIVERLQTQMLDAMAYLQENHLAHRPLTPESIVFTEYNQNLKLLNVGYDQTLKLTPADTEEDIRAYGRILEEVLNALPASLPKLRKVARKCSEGQFHSVPDVMLALERRSASQIYMFICLVLVALIAMLVWLTSRI